MDVSHEVSYSAAVIEKHRKAACQSEGQIKRRKPSQQKEAGPTGLAPLVHVPLPDNFERLMAMIGEDEDEFGQPIQS